MTNLALSSEETQNLYAAATAALAHAYAPYSGFRVGAALRSGSGVIITGVNVENAAYPQTICAERSAVVSAVSGGLTHFTDIAIAYQDTLRGGDGGPIRPCGGCLSVLHEFSPDGSLRVHSLDAAGKADIRTLRELLPLPFVYRGMAP